NRQNSGGEHDVPLQLRRQRTDVINTGNGQDDVDLLHADLDVAFRHQLGHGNAVDELDPVLHLVGDAEPLHQVRDVDAARAGARIGDRLGGEHRALEGGGGADVGLGRSSFYRDADPRAGEVHALAHDLALLDKTIDDVWSLGDQIRRRVGIDLLHHRIAQLEADDDFMAARALESGREV